MLGRLCPLAHLEATGDQTVWTESHSGLHDQPDFHISSCSGLMAKPAEQTEEGADRWRSKYSSQSLESCNKVCSAAWPLQARKQCSRNSSPGGKTAGSGSHVGQAGGELTSNLRLSGGYKKTRGFEVVERATATK